VLNFPHTHGVYIERNTKTHNSVYYELCSLARFHVTWPNGFLYEEINVKIKRPQIGEYLLNMKICAHIMYDWNEAG
jgi:hypothetical protein